MRAGTTRSGTLAVQAQRTDGVSLERPSAFLFDHTGREIGSLSLESDGHGTRALAPGRYEVMLLTNNAEWRRKPFTIKSEERTAVSITVPAATRRYILLPWPMPEKIRELPHDATIHCVIENHRGHVLVAETLNRASLPYMYMPCLSAGAHRVRIELGDGSRYAGTFDIQGLRKSHKPVLISVVPVR